MSNPNQKEVKENVVLNINLDTIPLFIQIV